MSYSYSTGNLEDPSIKQYAIVIFLPPSLEQVIAPVREQFDPDYHLIPAHVTLVFPFETSATLEELSAVILAETENMGPLRIELESIDDFYPACPIIYWRVKECDRLHRLYTRLYARLDIPLPHKQFLPHVTLAREISNHRIVLVKDQIASWLTDEVFDATSIDLVSPIVGYKWVSVRTFPVAVG